MGPILEAALYKAALLYVKAGKYGKAIARFRYDYIWLKLMTQLILNGSSCDDTSIFLVH